MTGSVTVAPGRVPSGGSGGVSGVLSLSVKNLTFRPTALTALSGGQIIIHFTNDDANVPHNVVVFNGKDASAPQLFSGAPVTGPGSIDYSFKAPPPETYFFHCVFHPTQMTGTLIFRTGSTSVS